MTQSPHIVIVGGGAAGFFAAITAKSINSGLHITLLEGTDQVLRKVMLSGGGRCNVTHACFEPAELVKFYPRGNRELLGPFHKFQPRDMVAWLESHGVPLKTEADGRIFPISDSAQSIVDCFTQEAQRLDIDVRRNTLLKTVDKQQDGRFALELSVRDPHSPTTVPAQHTITFLTADRLLLACGGTRNHKSVQLVESLGHSTVPPVPSLFSFRVKDSRLAKLSGIAKQSVTVSAENSSQTGAILITHEGFSGPAILKLSAWQARVFAEKNYHFNLDVDWTAGQKPRETFAINRRQFGKRQLGNVPLFDIPQRLWERLLAIAEVPSDRRWLELRKTEEEALNRTLVMSRFQVSGKSLNKEEFVTCGGVPTKEVDFRTMESKLCPGLYFAGEMLDIDGITGGFNFQNAWTTARLAGQALAHV